MNKPILQQVYDEAFASGRAAERMSRAQHMMVAYDDGDYEGYSRALKENRRNRRRSFAAIVCLSTALWGMIVAAACGAFA